MGDSEKKERPVPGSGFNLYGDRFQQAVVGCGPDIGSQRADDLDELSLEWVRRNSWGSEVRALDAACGYGGQAVRLARAGAHVVAFDSADLSAEVRARAVEARVQDRVTFSQGDLRGIDAALRGRDFDLVCCQRAIHYLRWSEAVAVVQMFRQLLRIGGRLYLSASGLYSELGDGYPWLEARETRYAPLSDTMRERHGIRGDVCLYTESDLAELFLQGGMTTETIFRSQFGNVKGVAVKEEGDAVG